MVLKRLPWSHVTLLALFHIFQNSRNVFNVFSSPSSLHRFLLFVFESSETFSTSLQLSNTRTWWNIVWQLTSWSSFSSTNGKNKSKINIYKWNSPPEASSASPTVLRYSVSSLSSSSNLQRLLQRLPNHRISEYNLTYHFLVQQSFSLLLTSKTS